MSADQLQPGPPEALSTTVSLPFPALERATWAARGQLRAARDEQALPAGPVHLLEWDTLVVDGPIMEVDPDGRSWFTYTAKVSTRALRPVN